MIEIQNLTKQFNDKKVLDNLNLHIEQGEKIAIIGPSGCGKSTFIKVLVGLLPIQSGTIKIYDQNLPTLDEDTLYDLRSKIGFVFQSSALFDSLTIKENLAFPLRERKHPMSESDITTLVKEKLRLVEMTGYENMYPSNLSGGQKRRIGIARALITNPSIILYDEPTAGLDPQLVHIIEDLIVRVSDNTHATSIVITHQVSTMLRTADKIYFMDKGRFLNPETPKSIQHTQQESIRDFFVGEFDNTWNVR